MLQMFQLKRAYLEIDFCVFD